VILQRLMQITRAISMELKADGERASARAKQAATALACVAVAAGAMPVMAHRAEEQREEAALRNQSEALSAALNQVQSGRPVDPATLYMPNAREAGTTQVPNLWAYTGNNDSGAGVTQVSVTGNAQPATPVSTTGLVTGRLIGETPTWQANAMSEQDCLARAVYFEARGETLNGQYAVAEVVINRVRSTYYPNTICGVVFQGSQRRTGCQFSFTCDGSLRRGVGGAPWTRAQEVARNVIAGSVPRRTGGATHYHTDWVDPHWNNSLIETTRIGTHIFYRMPRNSERAIYASGRRGDFIMAASAVADALTGADAAATPTLDGKPLDELVAPPVDPASRPLPADEPVNLTPAPVAPAVATPTPAAAQATSSAQPSAAAPAAATNAATAPARPVSAPAASAPRPEATPVATRPTPGAPPAASDPVVTSSVADPVRAG
jgi:hypothetical protein